MRTELLKTFLVNLFSIFLSRNTNNSLFKYLKCKILAVFFIFSDHKLNVRSRLYSFKMREKRCECEFWLWIFLTFERLIGQYLIETTSDRVINTNVNSWLVVLTVGTTQAVQKLWQLNKVAFKDKPIEMHFICQLTSLESVDLWPEKVHKDEAFHLRLIHIF